MDKELKEQEKELSEDIATLSKKVCPSCVLSEGRCLMSIYCPEQVLRKILQRCAGAAKRYRESSTGVRLPPRYLIPCEVS